MQDSEYQEEVALEIEQLIEKGALLSGKSAIAVILDLKDYIDAEYGQSMTNDPRLDESSLQSLINKMFSLPKKDTTSDNSTTFQNTTVAMENGSEQSSLLSEMSEELEHSSDTKECTILDYYSPVEPEKDKPVRIIDFKEGISCLDRDSFTLKDLAEFKAIHQYNTGPVVLPKEYLGLKKFIVSAGTCDRYHGKSTVDERYYFDPRKFIGLAERLASAVAFAGQKNSLEYEVVDLLAKTYKGITPNRETYYQKNVIATPDALIEEGDKITTVFELKGYDAVDDTTPTCKKGTSTKTLQLVLSMVATGAHTGYLICHSQPLQKTKQNFKPSLLKTVEVKATEERYRTTTTWLSTASHNLKVFWRTYHYIKGISGVDIRIPDK